MVGAVTDDGGEPRLALSLVDGPRADSGGAGETSERRVEAVIDTGFNGELTLPSGEIRRLGYPRVGTVDAELADGTTVETDYFAGRLLWHGEVREANVLAAEGAPLVGMGLLSGSRLTVEAAPGGAVGIEEMVG